MSKDKYQEFLISTNKMTNEYKEKDNRLSKLRLVFFLLALLFIAFTFFMSRIKILFWILADIMIIVFIFLIVVHRRVSSKLNYYLLKEEVIKEYIDRFSDEWHNFKEDGLEYEKKDNKSILSDLDIIGKESLYKFLCIAKTKEGKNKLINSLSNQKLNDDELLKKQNAVKNIIENTDFSIDFQVALKEYDNNFEKASLSYIRSELGKTYNKKILPLIINIILTITTYLTLICLKFNTTLGLSLFISFMLINFFYGKIYARCHNEEATLINELSVLYKLYSPMIKSIQSANFNDELLYKYQYCVLEFDNKKDKMIREFSSYKSYQNNFLASLIVNGLFPFTTFELLRFNNFINLNKKLLLIIPDTISNFEELGSLAIIGQVKENWVMPTLSEKSKIDFENLTHPLINENKVVANSFHTGCETTIITGSNMSGKTSFLRTIGINLILMQAGTAVTATKFSAGYFKIFTSMRITDDISKGISSFYRELLRIKEAIDYAKTTEPMIALIDEVFRGTNANDRIAGAIEMIKFLQLKNVVLMITTHDQQLCTIENVKLHNYYFSEYYEDNQIKFDYKIKEGICPTTNAKYLMKLAGIIK